MTRTTFCISRHPGGCRVHILGCRIHHGLACQRAVWRDRTDVPWLGDHT